MNIDTDTKIYRIAKWVTYGLLTAFLAVFVALCIAVGAKNHKIKEYKAAMKYQSEIVDSLNRTVNDLWGQECIHIESTIQLTQKGLINTSAANNISRSVNEITRGELLMALDSLQRMNNEN